MSDSLALEALKELGFFSDNSDKTFQCFVVSRLIQMTHAKRRKKAKDQQKISCNIGAKQNNLDEGNNQLKNTSHPKEWDIIS